MDIGERIKNRRRELGITVEEVCSKIGKNRASVYRYEKESCTMPVTVLEPLAEVLQTSVLYLLGLTDNVNVDGVQVAIYDVVNKIENGYSAKSEKFIFSGEQIEVLDSSLEGSEKDECFVLNNLDDTMYPRIMQGDKLLCHRCNSVENGKVAVVYDGNDVVIRQILFFDDGIEIVPVNNAYPPKRISKDSFRIIAQVLALIRKF